MNARIVDRGAVTESFEITNGVKQGCIIAPILFRFVIAYLIKDAISYVNEGIDIRYRCD